MPHRLRLSILFTALLICLTSNLSASQWMVAAASHAPGASNTSWRTDLRIVNPTSAAANATIYLLPANSDNSARSHSAAITVPAFGQLSLPDVLDAKFAFSGNAAVLVESSSTLVVTSRTYNLATNGATYGQFIAGVPVADALQARETGHLVYLSKSDAYRTNVGFAGTTGAAGSVAVTLYDASGTKLGNATYDVPAYGQLQVNDIFASTGSAAVAVARAEVVPTVPMIAYASVIDNRTGDPIALIAQHASESRSDLAIAAVGHAAGAGGSLWRSDVRIFNPSDSSASVTLSYYPSNVANPTPVTKTVSIGGRQLLALDDVVATTFANSNGTGALRVQSAQKLFVTSRTYNQSTAGTFGQDIPAVATESALAAGSVAKFSGLSNSGYRTNVGFFNYGSTAADLTLELRGPAGDLLATKSVHLDGNMVSQINDLFAFMGASGATAGSLWITTSGGTVIAYASVIDNVSGDPVYVPASIGPPATPVDGGGSSGSGCVTIPLIRAGLKATYHVTGSGEVTRETTYVSDTTTQTVITEKSFGAATSNMDSTFTYTVQNGLRALTHSVSVATTNAAGFAIEIDTESTFSTPMVLGPVSNYCSGQTWAIPALTQTVTVGGTFPGPTTLINRPAATGVVTAVNESITTPAGTFLTVRYHGVQGITDPKTQSTDAWVSIADGVPVRILNLDANGATVASMELTSLQ
jgi:hypothetical protein